MSWIVAATAALKQLALIAIIHWMVSIVALVLVVYPAMTYFALAVSLAFVVWITVYVAAASFIIFVVALSTAFLIAGYGASQFFESPIVALICWLAILAHSGLGNFLLYRIETLQTLR